MSAPTVRGRGTSTHGRLDDWRGGRSGMAEGVGPRTVRDPADLGIQADTDRGETELLRHAGRRGVARMDVGERGSVSAPRQWSAALAPKVPALLARKGDF